MNLKLLIIIVLVLVLFVNNYLSCKKIEKFTDKTLDDQQDEAINNSTAKLIKLEKEYNETNNKLDPIRIQITDLDNTITKIDNKIKANLSLELTEKNSNRVRQENIRLRKIRRKLITNRNDLIRTRNSLIGTNKRLNREIRRRKAYNRSLYYRSRALIAQYRGLKNPGYAVFYNNRKKPIYIIRNNSNSRETNKNHSVLKYADYISVSPGHRVILFNNPYWLCKGRGRDYVIISGGDSGIKSSDPLKLSNYIRYSYIKKYPIYRYYRKCVKRRKRWGRRSRCTRYATYRRRVGTRTRRVRKNISVRLERIINNDYRKGKVNIRLNNQCQTPK